MAEIVVVPASAGQLVASVTLFGRKLPKCFGHPIPARLAHFLGGEISYRLNSATHGWLDAAAAAYSRMFIQSSARTLGLFEPMTIFLVGKGDIARSGLTVELMKRYLAHRMVPGKLISSEFLSESLQKNLYQFVHDVRGCIGGERLLKFFLIADKTTANMMNRQLRRIIPMAMFGRTGIFRETGTKIFFLSCPIVEPKHRTVVEKIFSVPHFSRAAYLFARIFPSRSSWVYRVIGQPFLHFEEEEPA